MKTTVAPVSLPLYCSDETSNGGSNRFHNNCAGDRDSDSIRQQACLADLDVSFRCPDVVTLLCTGQQGENRVTANPFNELCDPDDSYQTARETLAGIDMCGHETTVPTDSRCILADTVSAICAGTGEFSNPFAALCSGLPNVAVLKQTKCFDTEGNPDTHATCDDVIANGNVTSSVWQYKALLNDGGTPDEASDDTPLNFPDRAHHQRFRRELFADLANGRGIN